MSQDKSLAPPSAEKPAPPRFTRGPLVDNIEMVVMAVVLALTIRCFLIEAFEIPTGSMAPTLYGRHFMVRCENCGYRYAVNGDQGGEILCSNCGYHYRTDPGGVWGGDRLLVNKVLYRFEKPRRWSPFVFINPRIDERDPKTTYIKRLIGLPNDSLEIIRGDIVVNRQIQRKPPAAQSVLWMLVYDSRWPWTLKSPWLCPSPGPWRQDAGKLSVDASSLTVPTFADFAGHHGDKLIRDDYGYDRGPGANVVTDLRVRLDLLARGDGKLELVLPEDNSSLRCLLATPGAAEKTRVLLNDLPLDNQLTPASSPSLPSGVPVQVEFARVDFLVTLKLDGKEVFRHDLWTNALYDDLARKGHDGVLHGHDRSGVRIGVSGLAVDFSRVRIDRDIYYGADPRMWSSSPPFPSPAVLEANYMGPILLSNTQYLALGDNSPWSADSRYWGPVPEQNLVGKALVIWWYPTRVRLIQ